MKEGVLPWLMAEPESRERERDPSLLLSRSLAGSCGCFFRGGPSRPAPPDPPPASLFLGGGSLHVQAFCDLMD